MNKEKKYPNIDFDETIDINDVNKRQVEIMTRSQNVDTTFNGEKYQELIYPSSEIDKLLNAKKDSIQSSFDEIADIFMNMRAISIAKKFYRITELEFYLFKDEHEDRSTHKNELQLKLLYWYIHPQPLRLTNRKGLDLTMGDEIEKSDGEEKIKKYCSVLIRSICELGNTDNYVYGTSKVVDKILEETGLDLKGIDGTDAISNPKLSLIKDVKYLTKEKIYSAPRVGLPQKADEFKMSPYRYFISPTKKHAEKEKTIIPYWQETKKYSDEEIKKIFDRKTLPTQK